jgi:prepilin-type N-terminal cleavage/methylation domain-containing protein
MKPHMDQFKTGVKVTAHLKSEGKNGFTLIELLVVIAVIAILSVMLLPALAGTGNRPAMITDLVNCKQIMQAMQLFAQDHNEYMPQPGWNMSVTNWAAAANLPEPSSGGTLSTYNSYYPEQLTYFQNGQLFPYLKTAKILRCPSDVVNDLFFQRQEYLTSYVWNGGVVKYGSTPTNTIKVTDAAIHPTGILQWENDETTTGYGQWADFSQYPDERISRRHDSSVPVGFVDGSATQTPTLTFYREAGTYPTGNPPAGTGSGRNNTRNGNTATVPNDVWWF